MQVLLAVGWALLIGNLVFQASRSMLSGLGFEGEDPKILFARTFVFAFLLLASPQICEIGLNLTSNIMELLEVPDAVNVQLVDDSAFESLTAAWLLVIICDVILMFKILKLIVEIAERYIILAMLTITAPLAFATGGSRNTSDIFIGWCRMYGSMCLLMATHVIFFKILLSVVSAVPSGIDVFAWMVLVFGIVKAAKKADSIITRIGLNPALTGGGGRSLPGMLTYAVVRGAASGVSKTLGKSMGGGSCGAAGGRTPPGGGGPRSGSPFGGGKWSSRFGSSARKHSGTGSAYTYTGGNTAYGKQSEEHSVAGKQTPGQQRTTTAQQTSTAQHQSPSTQGVSGVSQKPGVSQQSGSFAAECPTATAATQTSVDRTHTISGQGPLAGSKSPQSDRKTSVPKGVQRGVSYVKTAPLSNVGQVRSSSGKPTPSDTTFKATEAASLTTAEMSSQVADARSTQVPARQEAAGAGVHMQPKDAVRAPQIPRKDGGRTKPEAGTQREEQFRSTRRQVTAESIHGGAGVTDTSTRTQPGMAGRGAATSGEAPIQSARYSRKPVPTPMEAQPQVPRHSGVAAPSSDQPASEGRPSSPITQKKGEPTPEAGMGTMRKASSPAQQEGHSTSLSPTPSIKGTASTHRPGTAGTAEESGVTGQRSSTAHRFSTGVPGIPQKLDRQVKRSSPPATTALKGQPTRKTAPKPPRSRGGSEHGR